ncbi:MAG: hypothetical protein NTW03_04050 [Verrucomicrobia bacterium]|nr:hypothetical protein [Verrucomicrobiota bacterium]
MATMLLPPEFKRLLSVFHLKQVEYLLIGGYAVIYHGYVRTTGDMDLWIALSKDNAIKAESAIRCLGFNLPGLKPALFLRKGSVLRIGQEPLRFDIVNEIDGLAFPECYARRVETVIDGVPVNLISLPDLKANKRASGRNKDLADLDYLP